MSRLLAALAAALILLTGARARAAQPATPAPEPKPGAAGKLAPSLSPTASPAPELDAATREIVRREVEKAKQEMREELRSELQEAQVSREAAEATGPVSERPRLDFLQVNGYFRLRSDLFDNLDLHRDPDPNGYYLFPRPLRDANNRGTLTTDNMRLRVEPTFNVSDQIRVLSQIDVLDDVVLGSTPEGLFTRSDGVALPFDSRGQLVPHAGVNGDRSSIAVKRAWAEVQTPLGLLSFGRMPSHWGLGMLSNMGGGVDDDYGDSVDRVQFALTPIGTPVGKLVFVPMYEIVATGLTSTQSLDTFFPPTSYGLGQPFDRDPGDDAKAIGLKAVRIDTEEEMKRKFERGEGSLNFGLWYMYKSQTYLFTPATTFSTTAPVTVDRLDAFAHTIDLWTRWQTKRFRLELEGAAIIGERGPALLRQFGAVLQGEYTFADGRLALGGEVGFASGDSNPGFGARPGRPCFTGAEQATQGPCLAGSFDGPQYSARDQLQDERNFRFNPAYRVDLVLFRQILGGVTDALYFKPTLRYELLEGLTGQVSIVYSQAMEPTSTPSTNSRPLGIEADLSLRYQSDDGFFSSLEYGVFQPLAGFDYAPFDTTTHVGRDPTRGHNIHFGVGVKF